MASRGCKQATTWLAALESGDLDPGSRIRLHDHLDDCPDCREQAHRVGLLVELLRDEEPQLSMRRRDAIWRRVQQNASAAQGPAHRRLARWAAAAVLLIALAAGAVWLLQRPDANESGQRLARGTALADAGPSATGRTAPPPRSPRVRRDSWRIDEGKLLDAHGNTVQGQPAADVAMVAARQRPAVLHRAQTELRVDPGSSVVLQDDGAVRLLAGQLQVRSRPGAGEDLTRVQVAELTVRPVGTHFAVAYHGADAPRIDVYDGRVEVASAGRTIAVAAGSYLVWGQAPRPLQAETRQRPPSPARAATTSKRSPAGRRPLPQGAQAQPVPAGPRTGAATPAGPAEQTHDRTQTTQPRPTPDATAPSPVASPASPLATSMRQRVQAIERLLARGDTRRAREQARTLAQNPRAAGQRPALLTLVAESLLKERRHAAARDAYLETFAASPASIYGAAALYGAASLELEHLARPGEARTHLRLYLKRFPRGHQREGAHYLLFRALRQLGRHVEAAAVSRRYREQFPGGQFTRRMQAAQRGTR